MVRSPKKKSCSGQSSGGAAIPAATTTSTCSRDETRPVRRRSEQIRGDTTSPAAERADQRRLDQIGGGATGSTAERPDQRPNLRASAEREQRQRARPDLRRDQRRSSTSDHHGVTNTRDPTHQTAAAAAAAATAAQQSPSVMASAITDDVIVHLNDVNESLNPTVMAESLNPSVMADLVIENESSGVVASEKEVVFSESDDEWCKNSEVESVTGSDELSCDEETKGGNESDELSCDEESYDVVVRVNSDEDRDEIYIDRDTRGKEFSRGSNGKIELEKGLLFVDVCEFREALKDFVIQEGFEINRIKNEKARVTAVCAAAGCTWRIHASPIPDGVTYKIKTYNPEHNCIRTTQNSNATSTWIAKQLQSKLVADPNMSFSSMKVELMEKFGLESSGYMKLYRARKRVKEQYEGSYADSYDKLPAWAKLARETNPGSLIKMELEGRISTNPQFKRFFVCLDAMKKGFVKGCRPWFGIDGCHLKGNYGGVLLSAVAIDGNKGMFPIAFAVVEGECLDSWKFFLSLLHEALASVHEWREEPLTIMSDMQKGLRGAVGEFFPFAKHRYCCNHLLSNFKLHFKTLVLSMNFWSLAKAYNDFIFEKGLKRVSTIDENAVQWLLSNERPKEMWARHTCDPRCKSDHITNNVAESFNNWVGDDRKKPILGLVESLTTRIMARFQRRYEKGCTFEFLITPRIRKIVDTTMQDGRFCTVTYAGEDEFQVRDGFTTFAVNLRTSSCGCQYWRLSGLPCIHACACIAYKRRNVERYCDHYYSISKYYTTYQELVHPMPELDERDRDGFPKVDPPKLKRLPGRPRRVRRRGPDEGRGTQSDSRRSSTVKCSICKQFGHNKKGCQRAKTAKEKKQEAISVAVEGITQSSVATETSIRGRKKRQRIEERDVAIENPSQLTITSSFNQGGQHT